VTPADDQLLRAVANLRPMMPDQKWEERVRVLCHLEIARRASGAKLSGRRGPLRLIDAVAVALLCAYLSVLLREAARLGGL
jgi:hypothetical protein